MRSFFLMTLVIYFVSFLAFYPGTGTWSFGGHVLAQDFDEDSGGFEPGYVDEGEFYPAEPLFESGEDGGNSDESEPPPIPPPMDEDPGDNGRIRGRVPRRGRPNQDQEFGGGAPSFRPSGGGSGVDSNRSFGQTKGEVRFERRGEVRAQDQDPLERKRQQLEDLQKQYKQQFSQ